jgi:hypothetical protein
MITHEQACELRVGAAKNTPDEDLERHGYVLDFGYGNYATTEAGKQALAEYDASIKRCLETITNGQNEAVAILEEHQEYVCATFFDALEDLRELLGVPDDRPISERRDAFVSIERSELERLQALERKIWAFILGSYVTNGRVRIGQRWIETLIGNARDHESIRKAFDQFEVEDAGI